MMRVLVTGAAGFIGSATVRALLAAGHDVVGLDDLSTGRLENLPDGVELVRGSVTDILTVQHALDGCDGVIHLAAKTSVPGSFEDPETYQHINSHGTAVVLESARLMGTKRIVFASSFSVYGEPAEVPTSETCEAGPLSPYAKTKRFGEGACRYHGGVALRYCNVYGPRQRPDSDYAAAIPKFIDRFLDGQPITVYGTGHQTRDFVYVEDVARANVAALRIDGYVSPINIGTGRSVSILDVHKALCAIVGHDPGIIQADPRAGDVSASCGVVDRARDVLGWTAEILFADGLAATVAWHRAHR